MFKRIIILLLLLAILASCTTKKLKRYQKTAYEAGFNTFISLLGYSDREETFNDYFKMLDEEFRKYNQYFDIYNNYEGINNLKTINDNAGIKEVIIDKELFDFLKFAKSIVKKTSPAFDISSGALLKLWHDYREDGKSLNEDNLLGDVPPSEELEIKKQLFSIDKLILDENKSSAYLSDKEFSLDVGGIAKGYAASKVAEKLKKAGLKSAAIDAGGNIKLIGSKPDGLWRVGIVNPDASPSAINFDLKEDMTLVTSGDYQNYYKAKDNKIYHHIINLNSGYPLDLYHSVSIITYDSGLADALSTSLFNLSIEDGKKLIKQFPDEFIGVVYISSKPYETDLKSFHMNNYYYYYSDNLSDLIIKKD